MRTPKLWLMATCLSLPLVLAGCEGDDGSDGAAGPAGAPGAPGAPGQDATASTIALSFLGRYETGEFDESAAEIVDYDPATRQVFVVNANSGRIDILDISAPEMPTLTDSLDVAADIASAVPAVASAADLGAANSVAVSGNTLAVAVEAAVKQDNGYVAFYQTDGTFLAAVEAGALPDMVAITPDGNTALVANEGEPNGDYSVDPEGSITLIDISGGAGTVTSANVTQLRFTAFNAGGAKSLGSDVRTSPKSASVAQDLEPEYIAVSADSSTAWVALQENNAIAVIDVSAREISAVRGLGFKDHGLIGNELDASNRDGGINIRQWPLLGVYMPDTIDSYEYNGITYLVTANEGDGREYLTDADSAEDCTAQGGFDFDDGDCFHYLDEIRVGDILDSGASIELANLERFAPDLDTLSDNANLGRIKVITTLGVRDCPAGSLEVSGQPTAGCVYEQLYSYGGRSFSIFNGDTGELVFDSGSDFETITAQRLGADFNATNDENDGDDRSDDKGPEPEAIEIARIDGKVYAFIGLERVGGIMVYDITNPESAEFLQYINTRDFSVDIEELVDAGDFSAVGDLGPESIKFIAAGDSPTGEALLVVGNEVSGTTALFGVNLVSND
ncbi:choice-of-anchor I family protein [Haliea sp. E1-2-M8]|uniref:choice-of-anchor I family protein n=1 Tax=Haliea sp. E1-2-M8 TaxID=3064706 RepID=UPI00271ADE0F|nr:choice-of-anchor I family protein [Haliea sp. E1-2-M8]MDO8862558.1 choice-of-anchor I family protein [Haliea sp. E1-2-M8]